MKLLNTLLVPLILLALSCKQEKPKKVIGVFNALKIGSSEYAYSKKSELKIGKQRYSLRTKAVYDVDGHISKLTIYKPEEELEYSRKDLEADTMLLNYSGVVRFQKWQFLDGLLIKNGGETIAMELVDDSILKAKETDSTIFYILD